VFVASAANADLFITSAWSCSDGGKANLADLVTRPYGSKVLRPAGRHFSVSRRQRHSYTRRLLRTNLKAFLRDNVLGLVGIVILAAVAPILAMFLTSRFNQGVIVGMMGSQSRTRCCLDSSSTPAASIRSSAP